MPQVDLEAFVSSVCIGGSDHRKIACETLADDQTIPPYYNNSVVSPSDFPPESYFLSKDAQLEWLSDNAFFDRKDSQRGNSGILNSNPNSNPSSQRFLLKSKASIIGLPKPQKTCFNEAKQRRHGGKNRVILKRVGSRIKTDTSLLEPSSPIVSCIGRVKSRRERSRRMHLQKSSRVEPANRVKKLSLGSKAAAKTCQRVRLTRRQVTNTTSGAGFRWKLLRSRHSTAENRWYPVWVG
ncbi:hypothetical protein ISN45_Aa04g020810 [Arabidopsis thaliana x Arabidopsis arenosa]|uniref:Uncharacterized protein n=1 Tax=Arabidopsis thaliana x Arabidopsis arenosa TaxID=1240361 RepID=A0A8T2ABE2_9BRAS|nr:hypothetical protein ISN45_Aa04g020810 [Arabidopsis thaliana x Arabidopsis arenosa]